MEVSVNISGIGVVGGFGLGGEALLKALDTNPCPNGTVTVDTPRGAISLPAFTADETPLLNYVAKRNLRRVNRFSRLATLGACLALDDAGYQIPVDTDRIGIVVASGYGAVLSTFDFLDSMIDEDNLPSPTLFSNSVHSSALANLSILLNIRGPALTVSQFGMSTVSGLISACCWLRERRVDAVLFGAVEELCPVLNYSYYSLFGDAAQGPMRPDDLDSACTETRVTARVSVQALNRQSAVLGEGCAFFLLTRSQTEDSSGYGRVTAVDWCAGTDFTPEPGAELVLGADGHAACGKGYACFLETASTSIFSAAYGSLPAGQALDLAAAALRARAGRCGKIIHSVKIDAEDNCAIISYCAH